LDKFLSIKFEKFSRPLPPLKPSFSNLTYLWGAVFFDKNRSKTEKNDSFLDDFTNFSGFE
jgi:hypothetical protein